MSALTDVRGEQRGALDRQTGQPVRSIHQHRPCRGWHQRHLPHLLDHGGVTGGIGVDLKNWVKKVDSEGNVVLDKDGEPELEQVFSVDTGSVFTINTKTKKLCQGDKELIDISASLTPQKMEFMRAGGSYAIVFGKKLQTFAAKTLGIEVPPCLHLPRKSATKAKG